MMHDPDSHRAPADLGPVAAALDELGENDRAAMPPSVVDQAFTASRAGLATPPLRLSGTRADVRPTAWSMSGLRIAAAIAFLATAGAAWLALRSPVSAPPDESMAANIERDASVLLIAWSDEDSDALRLELDLLAAEAEAFDADVQSWSEPAADGGST